jgi:predicted transcriptional regulator of viral defense system
LITEAKLDKNKAYELFKRALIIARTIEHPLYKAITLCYIAFQMAKTGYYIGGINKVFVEALEVAKTIEDSADKGGFICDEVSEMKKAGLNKNEINAIFKEAGIEPPK